MPPPPPPPCLVGTKVYCKCCNKLVYTKMSKFHRSKANNYIILVEDAKYLSDKIELKYLSDKIIELKFNLIMHYIIFWIYYCIKFYTYDFILNVSPLKPPKFLRTELYEITSNFST